MEFEFVAFWLFIYYSTPAFYCVISITLMSSIIIGLDSCCWLFGY